MEYDSGLRRSESLFGKKVNIQQVVSREVFWHVFAKIPRHARQNAITEGDLECILTRNCEGTEQLQFIEKLVDGFVQYRMTVVWCDLIHRFQHKITVLHVDMRNVKIRSVDDLIVIKENVKI